ncbi:zinc-ribbon domain-containing protein [Chloroflexota bacterium]
MALIKCPECSNQISDKSMACPYCGLPSQYYASTVRLIGLEPRPLFCFPAM